MSRSIKVLALLFVLAFTVLGCACQPPYKGPANSARVAVVGDSVTDISTTSLQAKLSKTWRTSVSGVGGIDLPRGRTELVQPAVATKPDVLVVELGINSASNGWTSNDAHFIDLILKDAAKVPCVVWLLPDALDNTAFNLLADDGLLMTDRIAALRKSIQRRVAANPNLHLADFGPLQRSHPEWYAVDGLHPSPAGTRGMANFLDQSIRSYC